MFDLEALEEEFDFECEDVCWRLSECAYAHTNGNLSFCQYCLIEGRLRGEPASTCSKFKPRTRETADENREILY